MQYKKTVLDNGVVVLSETMDSVRSVSLGIWFQVGSRDENEFEAGLSHFNEHMMFKGTPTKSAREISELFDRYGARQNAFTSREATCYYAQFIDESLENTFELISDMVLHSELEQSACELEREVIIEEIARSEDDPEDRVYELFARSFNPGHEISKPIAGTKESVSSFGSKEAHAYHEKHYHANNCVVVAVGNVKHEDLVALAQKYLSELCVGKKNTALSRVLPSLNQAGRVYEHMPIEQSHVLIGAQTIPEKAKERHAIALLNFIYGGSMSSRLFQEVREKQGLVYTIYSGLNLLSDSGQFIIYAGTRPENFDKIIETSYKELEKMAQGDIKDSDLEMAKSATKSALALGLESTASRMRSLGRAYLSGVELLSYDERVARIDSVTLEELVRQAEILHNSEKMIAVVGPEEIND